jgi:acetylornithine deacetylase/succinyl-diaminopimelate desuccinylase-like protein
MVFPEGTNVTVKHDGDKLLAPGIGDDDRGLAVVLAVVRAFEKSGVLTNGTVYFVGDVGEEGPGNLRGMRHLFGKELKGKVDYFISVDDAGLGIASRAAASNRYRVTYKGPRPQLRRVRHPNPIHALGRAIAALPTSRCHTPKTTFNVGIIQGGTWSTPSPATTMEVDMRSESAASLDTVNTKVRKFCATPSRRRMRDGRCAAAAKLTMIIDTIGIFGQPAQSDAAPIVQTALGAAKASRR